jgi:predicted 3-demethylubiquinone-9 3-methyltransferase (glyoxalase superfamily)
MVKPAKNTIGLWYDGGAEDAARFYAEPFFRSQPPTGPRRSRIARPPSVRSTRCWR